MSAFAEPQPSHDLPPQLAIMVVDTKGFSKHDDLQQNRLSKLIPRVLEAAAHRCQLAELWTERRFPDSTGDGYIVGFAPALLTRVVDNYLDTLQTELRLRAGELRADGITMRMRLSLNLGQVETLRDPHVGSPSGHAMIATHRLVDAEPVRALLDRSEPDVTYLAAVLSEPAFDAVVRGGFSALKPSEFVKSPVRIESKDFTGTAYLRVPTMSGDLLAHGLLGVQDADRANPTADTATPVGSGGVAGSSVNVGDVSGGVGVLGPVSGSNNTIARGGIDQSRRISIAGRDQYNADNDINISHRSGGREERP